MTTLETAVIVGILAVATFATRSISFMLFPANRPTPRYVAYLGKVLPFAITGMLIVFCLKDVTPFASPFALPEVLAIALVAALYLLAKNSLLAIAAGTVLYMVLVQFIF